MTPKISKSVFSFLRTLTKWHCPPLLLSADYAAIDRAPAHSSKPAAVGLLLWAQCPCWDRQTDRQTVYCADPAPRTSLCAVPIQAEKQNAVGFALTLKTVRALFRTRQSYIVTVYWELTS